MTVFDCRAAGLDKNGVFKKTFWRGAKFDPEDLVEYLENDSFHQTTLAAMREAEDTVQFGGRLLRFKTYYLDAVAQIQAFSRLPGVQFEESDGEG